MATSKDKKVFVSAATGFAHISIAVAPGFTLPAFVSLVDAQTRGCWSTQMSVVASTQGAERQGMSPSSAWLAAAVQPALMLPNGAAFASRPPFYPLPSPPAVLPGRCRL